MKSLNFELPFFTGACEDRMNFGFPSKLNFNLYLDENTGIYSQKGTSDLHELLREVYSFGSLANGSISSESGGVYLNKIVPFIESNFLFEKDSRILEIGIGKGHVINSLSSKYDKSFFVGFEPGNFDLIFDFKENVLLFHDFFQSEKIEGKFDLIYSLFVIEHIENPSSFLMDFHKVLHENSKVVIAVPNCEDYIEYGDVSMLLHEHFSYFTRHSLTTLANTSGFHVIDIQECEGAIFAVLGVGTARRNALIEGYDFLYYLEGIERFSCKLNKVISEFEEHEIAVYCPIRAMNQFYMKNLTKVRLVDDSNELIGKYLPLFESKVESLSQMRNTPPKLILIYSWTFGAEIKNKCCALSELNTSKILTVEEISKS